MQQKLQGDPNAEADTPGSLGFRAGKASQNMGRGAGKRKGCEERGKLRDEMRRMLVWGKKELHFYKREKNRSTGN